MLCPTPCKLNRPGVDDVRDLEPDILIDERAQCVFFGKLVVPFFPSMFGEWGEPAFERVGRWGRGLCGTVQGGFSTTTHGVTANDD